jgi:hypothetical protein
LPARFETLENIRAEAWRQLRAHVPALRPIEKAPPFVPDKAINDPDPVELARRLPQLIGSTASTAALQNLSLTPTTRRCW